MGASALAQIDRRIREHWRPAKRRDLDEWADAHYVLPEGDANAGRWRTLPYQRGIMRAISDPGIEYVSLMKSARIGYTRGCICAGVGYFMSEDPSPLLLVQPTIDDGKKFSKEDIATMLHDVVILRGLVAEARSRDGSNTITEKFFRGGSLSIVGANSPRGFRRTSRRVVIFDEVDGYPASAGTEGDPIALGIRRSEYYWNRKIIAGSTPTLAGYSRIEALFTEGDQRRYYVPCPHCGDFQVLKFPNLKWPTDHPEQAHFLCVANGCVIEPASKRAMVEAGEWRAEAPEHFTPDHRHASFHIWAAYSYSPNASWGQLATEFIKANRGGALTLQTFVNTALGETYHARGEAPEWEPLMRRREPYPIGTVPAGVLFLTAGVDVQKDRLVAEVVGWGRGKTSWSIDYLILPGDTSTLADAGPWAQLDALLGRSFPHVNGQVTLPVRMLAIDSGYNTTTVYAWARRHPMNRVIAIKGQTAGGMLIHAPTPVDVSSRGKRLKAGYKVWPVCGHVAKSELYGWLRLEVPVDGTAPAPGFCHFPEYNEDYFRELTAEHLVPVKTAKGYVRMDWAMIPGRRNEALDARVYARAAAAVYGIDRFTDSDWRILERAIGDTPATPSPAASHADPPEGASRPTTPTPARTPWLAPKKGWLR